MNWETITEHDSEGSFTYERLECNGFTIIIDPLLKEAYLYMTVEDLKLPTDKKKLEGLATLLEGYETT
jgi:mannose/fructose/N-acetylgalactosamine-specific phosphotransferase system component IID